MADLQESVRSLLREGFATPSSASYDDDAVKESKLSRLCDRMIRHLQDLTPQREDLHEDDSSLDDAEDDDDQDATFLHRRKSYHGSQPQAASPSLRSVLGNLSLEEISQFSNVLTSRMTERLQAEHFLPATQDAEANAAALHGPAAQKLPRRALVAATLYVQLLQRPGVLGAGFVQTSALTALAALLKRWRVEIQDTCATKSRKDSSTTAGSKRSRQQRSPGNVLVESDSDHMSEDDNDESHGMGGSFQDKQKLTPQAHLRLGLQLSLELARLPMHREFQNWSLECREAAMEAVSSVLGTAAALAAPSRKNNADPSAVRLAEQVTREATNSLAECLLVSQGTDDDDDEADDDSMPSSRRVTARHETMVCICRGLFHVLTWKEILPFGEAGKQAASTAASAILEKMIQGLSDSLPLLHHVAARTPKRATPLTDEDAMTSPNRSTPTLSNKTPRTLRKIRLSVAGSSRKERMSLTPPRLKGTARRASAASLSNKKVLPIFSAILGLLQKITTDKAMEKSTVRNACLETIQQSLGALRLRERRHFLQFLIQACHSREAVHRLMAAEIIGRILPEAWLWTEHAGQTLHSSEAASARRKSLSPLVIASEQDMPSALFGALAGRLSDRVPTVRAASLSALAGVLRAAREAKSKASTRGASVSAMGLSETLNSEVYEILEVLRLRATLDARATVRRYAVVAMGEVFMWSPAEVTEHDLALLRDRCQDSSMMTRRAAAETLTSLVETGEHILGESIQLTWISAVLPLCLDSEGTCAGICLEFAQRLMLHPILNNLDPIAMEMAWSILAKLGDGSGRQGASRTESDALRVAVAKLLELAADSGRVKVDMVRLIQKVATETMNDSDDMTTVSSMETRRTGVWCLFDAFVRSFKDTSTLIQLFKRKTVDVSFLATAWKKLLTLSNTPDLPPHSLQQVRGCIRKAFTVLAAASRALDDHVVRDTKEDLLQLLCDLSLPENIIGSAVGAMTATTLALASVGNVMEAQAECKVWINQLLDSCEATLADAVSNGASTGELTSVARALFTTGELSMVGFNSNEDGPASRKEAESMSAKDFQVKGILGLHVKPTATLIDLVLSFLAKTFPGSAAVDIPENIRAYAFLTHGKMCLRDVDLAKRTMTVLARELHVNMSNGSSVIQGNVLLIMGDLCVKYTSLADRYLPVMAACLQSGTVDISTSLLDTPGTNGFEVVRKSAVILLSSLIMQDYIKWRGLLFHRFLVAVADENEEVSELAETSLSGPLLVKTPKLFINHFVESFFVLNRCTAHPMYAAAATTADGGSGITVGFDGIDLTGEVGRVRRMKMYEMMLSKMSDEEKIEVTAKMAKEILGSALIEGSDLYQACTKPLNHGTTISTAFNVLSDAMTVFRSESIRVGKSTTDDSDDIEDPDVDGTTKRIFKARSRMLSNISRQHLIEMVVPILCNLKALLHKSCSPLLKHVMAYMVDVYTAYKKEVQEVLLNDPTLLQEIEYDARQSKKEPTSREGSIAPPTPFVVAAA